MRAAVYTGAGGPEVIQVQERPIPEYGPELVLVRVKASGLNRADTLQRRGQYPVPPGAPRDIPGLEFAGLVEAVGAGVSTVTVGQRVFGLTSGGGQAEYLVSHERLLVPIPDNLDFVQAAAIPEAFITASDALFTQGELKPGERVLVHAVGSGVGLAVLEIARAAGCAVIGTSRSAWKLERARQFGLHLGVDTTREDFVEAVKRHTAGEGVQVVIDFVGGDYLGQNLACLATQGRLVQVATLAGTDASLNLGLLMRKRARIVGTVLRSRPLEDKAAATRLFANQIVPQLSRGLVRPAVDRVFPLDQLAEAHRYMEADKNFGKLVLTL